MPSGCDGLRILWLSSGLFWTQSLLREHGLCLHSMCCPITPWVSYLYYPATFQEVSGRSLYQRTRVKVWVIGFALIVMLLEYCDMAKAFDGFESALPRISLAIAVPSFSDSFCYCVSRFYDCVLRKTCDQRFLGLRNYSVRWICARQ